MVAEGQAHRAYPPSGGLRQHHLRRPEAQSPVHGGEPVDLFPDGEHAGRWAGLDCHRPARGSVALCRRDRRGSRGCRRCGALSVGLMNEDPVPDPTLSRLSDGSRGPAEAWAAAGRTVVIHPIAARSISASPRTGLGFTTARRSAGRSLSGCSPPSCGASRTGVLSWSRPWRVSGSPSRTRPSWP